MDVQEVLNHARDGMNVKRVFGEPYEKNGTTVIPVANVMGGAGAGGGPGMTPRAEAVEGAAVADAAGPAGAGYGMGYGMRATPAGAYVIRGDQVEWKPAMDMNALVVQRTLVAILGLLVFRSIVRTLAKR